MSRSSSGSVRHSSPLTVSPTQADAIYVHIIRSFNPLVQLTRPRRREPNQTAVLCTTFVQLRTAADDEAVYRSSRLLESRATRRSSCDRHIRKFALLSREPQSFEHSYVRLSTYISYKEAPVGMFGTYVCIIRYIPGTRYRIGGPIVGSRCSRCYSSVTLCTPATTACTRKEVYTSYFACPSYTLACTRRA